MAKLLITKSCLAKHCGNCDSCSGFEICLQFAENLKWDNDRKLPLRCAACLEAERRAKESGNLAPDVDAELAKLREVIEAYEERDNAPGPCSRERAIKKIYSTRTAAGLKN